MSPKNIFEKSLLYLFSIAIFLSFERLLVQFTGNHYLAMAITLLLLLSLHEQVITFLYRVFLRRTYLLTSRAERILDQLNTDLNRAYRYHEVIRTLYEAFKQLFPDIPHCFYILEDDKYYLGHYLHVDDEELLSFDLHAEYLDGIDLDTLIITDLHRTGFPEAFIRRAQASNLVTLLPFRGQNRIFAYLLINHRRIPFYGHKDAWKLMQKIQRKAGLVLERTALIIDLENRNFQLSKLLEVGQKILSSFDTKNVLDFILSTLKRVANYDAAAIFLLDESGKKLLNSSYEGYNPEMINNLHLKVGQGSCGWVVQSREMEVIDDVREAEHYYPLRPQTRSQVSIPLLFDNQVLGVICLESNRLGYFNKRMIDLLRLFAQMAAIAIHNARQFQVMLEKQALERELVNAGKIQQALLVKSFPHLQHVHITAQNIPSKIVSGDLYDIIRYDDFTIGLAIGDVSGKGAPAALMMTLILAGLRSQKQFFLTACDIVYRLNNLLFESTNDFHYATFFFAVISTEKKKIVYTNAGHDAPILLRANGQTEFLKTNDIVLGFRSDIVYHQAEISFEPGDLLFLYTDGITEAMNEQEEEFGEERLLQVLKRYRRCSVHEIRQKVIENVNKFTGRENYEDDLTMVICKFE